ncbi:Haloacid dehalogenase/epoxide hydrolase [Corchorus capsularis]|uniref:riboflavin kinase n=1 Tax=Corchorus capsularis TaxID=210143 RepID=A0A1R3JVM2_COCAP|nr:Haloacid dehalogenase/epoxide hydrolase [Corchorus capsularis]
MNSSVELNHSSNPQESKILAVILDLDGTLLDTERCGKGVLKEFLAKYGKELVKEREGCKRVGATHKESSAAIVKDYDLPLTPHQYTNEILPMYRAKWPLAKPLPAANRLIKHLHKHGVPLGLASNSIKEYIEGKISHQQGWKECFSVILGSDQVQSGKPSPDIYLEVAKRLNVDVASCLVIEDSLVGVRAAKAAGMNVVAVPPRSEADSSSMADIVLHSLLEFQPELWDLPPFEDWIDNALPLEPIHVKVQYQDGSVWENTEDEISVIPDQVYGVYFGWTKVDKRIIKIVASIGLQGTAKRNIQMCIVDENTEEIADQQIELVLVGYIRGFNSEVSKASRKDQKRSSKLKFSKIIECDELKLEIKSLNQQLTDEFKGTKAEEKESAPSATATPAVLFLLALALDLAPEKISAAITHHEQQCHELQPHVRVARGETVLVTRWIPPPADTVKINVDAAFDESPQWAGLGVVIYDSYGAVLICATKQCVFIQDSLFADVFSIRLGLQVARDEAFCCCILESDCLVAISVR